MVERDRGHRPCAFSACAVAGPGRARDRGVGRVSRGFEDSGRALPGRTAWLRGLDDLRGAGAGPERWTPVRWHSGSALRLAAVFCRTRVPVPAVAGAMAALDAV